MKKIWEKYSFIIILIIISYSLAFILINKEDQINVNDYVHVTIKEGDTLWKIANDYAEETNMYNEQFIDWVESSNGIIRNELKVGERIVIPLKSTDYNYKSVASTK